MDRRDPLHPTTYWWRRAKRAEALLKWAVDHVCDTCYCEHIRLKVEEEAK